jgi:hypothetical protein
LADVASVHLLYIMNNPLAGTDPTGYACEDIEGGVQCNFEASVLGSRIKTEITATVKGNDLSFSGSLVVGSDTLVSGSGMAKLGLAITGGGADRMARIDGNRGQAGVPNSPKGNPAGKDPGTHQAWAPPLAWTLPNWDSPWTWAVAPAAFVHEQIMRDTGRTTAAFSALLDPYGAAVDPVTGGTVAGVDAWEQRVATGLSLAPAGVARGLREVPVIAERYVRPTGTPTRAQRASVQNQPCVECGLVTQRQVADHVEPLVMEYYRAGRIDMKRAKAIEAVQAQCPTCSARQGAAMARFSRQQRAQRGLDDEDK